MIQWQSPEGAEAMSYHKYCTERVRHNYELNDQMISHIFNYVCGTDYLEAVLRGDISDEDTDLFLSLDGAQLY